MVYNPEKGTIMQPYTDLERTDSYIIREFSQNIDPIELMWHRDNEDRHVEILECGKGWSFQFEDELPIELTPESKFYIPIHKWHRVIKGEGNLKIKIWREYKLWEEHIL